MRETQCKECLLQAKILNTRRDTCFHLSLHVHKSPMGPIVKERRQYSTEVKNTATEPSAMSYAYNPSTLTGRGGQITGSGD